MATRVQLIDDLDGTDASETIRYTVDGKTWEIDLSDRNAAQFRKDLDKYIAASRPGQSTPNPRAKERNAPKRGAGGTKQIRAWAQANGHKLGDRGRIPNEIVEAFNAAHQVT